MEELRQEAALEISLQRHSYEDEIASLNRVLQERQCSDIPSPLLASPSTSKSTNLEEIESLLQDTQKKLAQPTKNSEVFFFFNVLVIIYNRIFTTGILICDSINVK